MANKTSKTNKTDRTNKPAADKSAGAYPRIIAIDADGKAARMTTRHINAALEQCASSHDWSFLRDRQPLVLSAPVTGTALAVVLASLALVCALCLGLLRSGYKIRH